MRQGEAKAVLLNIAEEYDIVARLTEERLRKRLQDRRLPRTQMEGMRG